MLTKRGKMMMNTLKLAVLCLLTVCPAARAQDDPRLVGETQIMQLDDETARVAEIAPPKK